MGPYLQGKEYETAFKIDGYFSKLIDKINYEYFKLKSRFVSSAAKKKVITIAIAKFEEAYKAIYTCYRVVFNLFKIITAISLARHMPNVHHERTRRTKWQMQLTILKSFVKIFKTNYLILPIIYFLLKRCFIVATFRDLSVHERENIYR